MRNIETTTNNLLFLLAAAPLGMGCIILTDDTDDTQGASTTDTPTSGTPVTGDTGDPPATTGPTGPTGEESTAGATTGEATTDPDDTGMVDSTTGGGLDPSVCADYGAHAVKCALPYADYAADGCYYNLDYQTQTSAECELAFLEYMACLSQLSCEELMGAEPCLTELDALLALGCPAVE